MKIENQLLSLCLVTSLLINCAFESRTKDLDEEKRMRCADTYFAFINFPPGNPFRDEAGQPLDRITNANIILINCLTFRDRTPRGFLSNGDPKELRP